MINKLNILSEMNKDGCRMSDKMNAEVGKGFNNEFGVNANMRIELYGKEGNLKEIREVHNTVTTAGKNGLMAQILAVPVLDKPGWMELGEGSPAATLLGDYIADSRVALTSKLRTDNVVTMIGDWGAGVGTGAVTEAGVFDVVTQNTVNMWMSASFDVVNKGGSDTLRITWTLTGS